MKNKSILAILIFLFLYTCNSFSLDSKLTELGNGWEITGGYDVVGKVHNNTVWINTDNPKTATEAWVYCERQGFCLFVDIEGYIHVDLNPGFYNIVPNSTPPNLLAENEKLVERD